MTSATKDGFNPELFSQLAEIEKGNFWHEARNDLLVWACRKYFSNSPTFLEIGCGTGFVLQAMAKAFPTMSLSGSELHAEALVYAKQRAPGARLMQMDARQIPKDKPFDLIGMFDVLEHISEDEKVLNEIYSALKPSGGLMLTVPQHPFLWSQYDLLAQHVRRYQSKDLENKLSRAGFKVLHQTSFVSLLLPGMLLSRVTSRHPDPNFSIRKALFKKGVLNWSLKKVLDLERQFIKLGVRLPVGGSLLMIARKPV